MVKTYSQLFAAMGSTGPGGIVRILNFLSAKPGYMPNTAGTLYICSRFSQKPCSNPTKNVKLP